MALVIEGLIIWESKCNQNYSVVCDGYVKYERAEVLRSAIMQDFRDNEEKIENGRLATILDFISEKFVMGHHCVRPSICFIFMVQLFCIFLSLKYHTITQIQNDR